MLVVGAVGGCLDIFSPVYRFSFLSPFWSGRVVRWCLVNFQCRDVLLIWKVEQGPTWLAIGAGGGCWTFFLSSIFSLLSTPANQFFLSPSGRWSYIG